MKSLRILLICLISLQASASVEGDFLSEQDIEKFFKEDPNKSFLGPNSVIDRKKYPFLNGIGQIKVSLMHGLQYELNGKTETLFFKEIEGAGSGLLVKSCIVMTNKHVVEGVGQKGLEEFKKEEAKLKERYPNIENIKPIITRSKLTFSVGAPDSSEQPFMEMDIPANVVANGSDYPGRTPAYLSVDDLDEPDSYDWAFIKLTRKPKIYFIPFAPSKIDPEYVKNCDRLMLAGFPGVSDPKDLRSPPSCKAYTASRTGFRLNCRAPAGTSGGPLFCLHKEAGSSRINVSLVGMETVGGFDHSDWFFEQQKANPNRPDLKRIWERDSRAWIEYAGALNLSGDDRLISSYHETSCSDL